MGQWIEIIGTFIKGSFIYQRFSDGLMERNVCFTDYKLFYTSKIFINAIKQCHFVKYIKEL